MKSLELIKKLLDVVHENPKVVIFNRDDDKVYKIKGTTRCNSKGEITFELHTGKSLNELNP